MATCMSIFDSGNVRIITADSHCVDLELRGSELLFGDYPVFGECKAPQEVANPKDAFDWASVELGLVALLINGIPVFDATPRAVDA